MIYCIREVAPRHLEISGFQDYDIPEKQYDIVNKICSCPARGGCKHQKMVDRFKEAGESFVGTFYDPDEDKFYHPIPRDERFGIPQA